MLAAVLLTFSGIGFIFIFFFMLNLELDMCVLKKLNLMGGVLLWLVGKLHGSKFTETGPRLWFKGLQVKLVFSK